MPVECTPPGRAAIGRRLTRPQPAPHCVARHAELPRDLLDRHAISLEAGHLLVSRPPLLLPLRLLPLRPCRCPLLSHRWLRHAIVQRAGLGRLAELTLVPVQHLPQRVGRIHHKMPAISHLNRRRRAGTDAIGMGTRAVAAHGRNLSAMPLQPRCQRVGAAIRQQVDCTATLEVADDGSIAVTAPPSPVVHPNHARRRRCRPGTRTDQPQQRVATDRHGEAGCQTRSRLAAQGKADVALDAAQAHGPARSGRRDVKQTLGKDPARAAKGGAAQAPCPHLDNGPAPLPRQVGQDARVVAVDPAGSNGAEWAFALGQLRHGQDNDAVGCRQHLHD